MPQKKLLEFLKNYNKPVKIMEVCGTHTVAIAKSGLRSLISQNIKLISGPGCPVCVTPTSEIDAAIELSQNPDIMLATFGDMLRVPGSKSSLENEKAKGARVEILYSPLDSLEIAKNNPEKEVVFIGVGFETTTPTVAATILKAKERETENFSVLSYFKVIPPALKAITAAKDVKVDGFILPGHVSAIIGSKPYEFLRIPSVIAGFEPEDVLQSIYMILEMIETPHAASQHEIPIQYSSVVRPEGNPAAVNVINEVLEPKDADWRGIGRIPGSGLQIKEKYSKYDAGKRFNIKLKNVKEPKGCACGEILKGIKLPTDCKLFGKSCNPDNPVGPCMVSSEGACSAYYKYGKN